MSLTQRSLFLAVASNLFPFSGFVLLHILGKGLVIKELAGPIEHLWIQLQLQDRREVKL